MSCKIGLVEFSGSKNCFASFPNSFVNQVNKNKIQVFSLKYGKDRIVYVSGSGTSHDQTNDVIHLNGLFANKLGICSGEKVIVEPISSVKSCHQVYVEPLSVDDWEILEIHQAYIQSHLLDQVRVITQGQILPIWVDKSVCIFVKIGNVEPPGDCVLLETLTEVIVTPKDRRNQVSSSGTPQTKANQIPEMANGNAVGAPTSNIQDTSNQSELDNYHDKKNENKFNDRLNTTYFNKLFTWASSLIVGKQNEEEVCDERENDDTDYELELLESSDSSIDTVFRVQRLRESDTCKCFSCDNHYDSIFDSCDTTYKSKSQLSYFTPDKESYSNTNTQLCQYLHHPTNVYVNLEDLNVDACHESFFASIEKLASPAEVKEIMKTKVDKLKAKNKSGVSEKTLEDPNSDSSVDMEMVEEREIVRVVILNNNKNSQLKTCSKLKVQNGHVVVHNLLRQKMSLSLGSKLRLQSVSQDPVTLKSLQLSPLFKVPAYFSDEMLKTAFKFWLRNYTNYQSPLVVNQNTFICIDLEKDKPGEFLVKYSTSDVTQVDLEYTLIDPNDLEDCNITVQRKLAALDPILVDLEEIDSTQPDISNQHLGGFSSYITSAYEHIQTCLATQPVVADIFTENHGIQNGCLLITGSKGSGKTSLAKAVCSKLSNWPSLAHVQMINCKPLKGKRIETLLQLLEKVSNEASWRAPSVILLDDLDHVTAAPSGPEAEVGGEATYFTRVSEILRDLLKSEITGNSKIALIATARSRSSLHGNLMSSRGTHLFQKVVEIKQPNKEERAAVLKAILEQDRQVKDSCIDTLDLQQVAVRTEGFTPKDLVTIVTRALHAHWTDKGHVTDDNVSLRNADFDNALEDFTPVSLRNVSLHTVGELGWSDVGGLHDVRNTLVDTLMLPSKYPQLFAACPLRLRSGLLLYGPPGSGKTLLAGVVAKECGLNFISIKGPELLNKYIGASEQAVRSTFIRAQSAKPCILFFDEFDSLAPRRGHDSTGVTDRVVNQLLTQLDGVEGLEGVCILAATSRPDLIDPALLRPGRLDKCLHCGIPTKDERLEILEALSRKVNLADDVDLDQVNTYCENFTGADLKALLYNAQLESIHDLQREHKIGSTNRGQHNSGYTSEDTSLKQVVEDIITGQSNDREQMARLKDGSTIQTDSNIVYMEKLEDGPVAVTADVGKSIQDKLKKLQTGVSVEQEESKMAAKEVVAMGTIVNQSCLVAAVKKMSPSVSAQERMKYEMIYSNFTKAKGSASLERGTRSTLA